MKVLWHLVMFGIDTTCFSRHSAGALLLGFFMLGSLPAAHATPVAWYRMEGTAGNQVVSVTNSISGGGAAPDATATGAAFDYAGNVPGAFIYDPITDTTVANSSSIAYSGGTAASYLNVSDSVSGPFDVPDFTIEMFIKLDQVLNVYRYFVSHEDSGVSGDGWAMRSLPNTSTGNYKASGLIANASLGDTSSPDDVDDGVWHHLAFVVKTSDPGNNYASFYMDHDLIASSAISGLDSYVADVDAPFRIFTEEYIGFIDEVRYSDQVLDSNQFLQAVVPEPGTLMLVFLGLTGVYARRRFVVHARPCAE